MTPGSVAVHEFTTEVRIATRSQVADAVVALEFVHPAGDDLPAWEPGAHVDLLLGDGLIRQYSLCGDPRDPEKWRIGVLRDPHSRGGSKHVHEQLSEGATVTVRGPRNHFELVDSPRYQFIAGGIGITPMMPMIAAADRAGADWSLVSLGRSKTTMAFAADLAGTYGEKVTVWADDERGAIFDLESALRDPRSDTEVYCCGPGPLMDAVEKFCSHWPEGSLHLERFAAKKPTAEEAAVGLDSYQVVCQRSGVTVDVEPGISMLEAIEDADVSIMSSCLDGVCGTCQTRVLEGIPDHRDSMLTAAERASDRTSCCGGPASERSSHWTTAAHTEASRFPTAGQTVTGWCADTTDVPTLPTAGASTYRPNPRFPRECRCAHTPSSRKGHSSRSGSARRPRHSGHARRAPRGSSTRNGRASKRTGPIERTT